MLLAYIKRRSAPEHMTSRCCKKRIQLVAKRQCHGFLLRFVTRPGAARSRRFSMYPARAAHFLFLKRFLEVPYRDNKFLVFSVWRAKIAVRKLTFDILYDIIYNMMSGIYESLRSAKQIGQYQEISSLQLIAPAPAARLPLSKILRER